MKALEKKVGQEKKNSDKDFIKNHNRGEEIEAKIKQGCQELLYISTALFFLVL